MKKLVLSLVLTLGVSGLALANNGNSNNEVLQENKKKEVNVINSRNIEWI